MRTVTRRVGDDYLKQASKIEVLAESGKKPNAEQRKEVRAALKDDQVMIRLSAPARLWLNTYNIVATEVEPEVSTESDGKPPENTNEDNKPT